MFYNTFEKINNMCYNLELSCEFYIFIANMNLIYSINFKD